MKMISENLGRIIAALAAIALLVCCVTAFRTDVSDFFDSVIGKETAIGDKVLGAMDAFDVSMNGSGGSDETQGGSGGSDETQGVLAAGLYETGTTTLKYSWDQLLENGIITVTGGVLTTGCNAENRSNSSEEFLIGDLIIDDSVTSIGDYAFAYMYFWGLHITIPDSVTSIASNAFYDCYNVESINIPAGISTIEDAMFCNCDNMISITIPISVTSIGEWAFSNGGTLTDVYYAGDETAWNAIDIHEVNDGLNDATIHYNSTGE